MTIIIIIILMGDINKALSVNQRSAYTTIHK